jgi:hypothetical protein|tara:strand:+ start:432 stop:887 length:456 start_codon:yes stop_codon:yes gene_type:complete
MNRERDAYRRMKQDAQDAISGGTVYNVKPIKPNYLSAVIWTSVVAAIVCSIFMGLLLYLVNESNIESNIENAASHAVYNLQQTVIQQNTQLKELREENKKIYDYLNLWTPIDCRRQHERWVIPGVGLPEIVLPDRLTEPEKYNNLELQMCE